MKQERVPGPESVLTYVAGEFARPHVIDVIDMDSQQAVHLIRVQMDRIWTQVVHRTLVMSTRQLSESRHPRKLGEVVAERGMGLSQLLSIAVSHLGFQVLRVVVPLFKKGRKST